ncbi:MAG: hypothetical protein AAF583_00590 [Pseudomonadota bacterium]
MSFAKAEVVVWGAGNESYERYPVHFNPTSLRITTTNQMAEDRPNGVSKPTSYKLDVELLFDTTEIGEDVYDYTAPLRDAAAASASGAAANNAQSDGEEPPRDLNRVTFVWGATLYTGYIESLNETLDYWSSDGTPLRSTVQVSLKGDVEKFLRGTLRPASTYQSANDVPNLPSRVAMSAASENDRAFTDAARRGGERSTGRSLAAQNGVENMRTGAGAYASASAGAGGGGASAHAAASASPGVNLQAAAGFAASGGISAGASAGFGMGASAGFSAGAGLGASVGVGMSGGAGIGMGGGFGMGVSASASVGLGASTGFTANGGSGVGSIMSASANAGSGFAFNASADPGELGAFAQVSTSTSSSGLAASGSGPSAGAVSAGVSASAGAFTGLGTSSGTGLPSAEFNPRNFLPDPVVPTATTRFDLSGKADGGTGAVAESWSWSSGDEVAA